MININYKLVGIALGILYFAISTIFKLEVFELVIYELKYLEKYELDEIIISIFIILFFYRLEHLKREKEQDIELEKMKIYTAMLSSTHHIINNLMNQMTLFKITAQKTPDFDPKILAMYEKMIDEASSQIKSLGDIEKIDEGSINKSVKP